MVLEWDVKRVPNQRLGSWPWRSWHPRVRIILPQVPVHQIRDDDRSEREKVEVSHDNGRDRAELVQTDYHWHLYLVCFKLDMFLHMSTLE